MNVSQQIRRATLVVGLALPLAVMWPAVTVTGQNGQPAKAPADQQAFTSPDEALAALKAAVSSSDKPALQKMFGPAIGEIASGDDVADKASFERFAKRLAKMTNLVPRGESTVVLYVGAENWPFPFPLTRGDKGWFFDGPAGIQEIADRRVGENELTTIRVCREYVRVQEEYASADRDADEVLEYAQRVRSTPGSKDGLYWESDDGDESPLGPLVATATVEGYTAKSEPQPFHGYRYRILTRQGRGAPGGAYDYVINGNMIGGFALVAYPARWGSSGIMTFIVSHQGKVYQKDLGPNTAALGAGLRAFNPDATWSVVEEN
jgi:hypothetical protein